MPKEAKYIMTKLLDDGNVYTREFFGNSMHRSGIKYFKKSKDKYWQKNEKDLHVLEIGEASGSIFIL